MLIGIVKKKPEIFIKKYNFSSSALLQIQSENVIGCNCPRSLDSFVYNSALIKNMSFSVATFRNPALLFLLTEIEIGNRYVINLHSFVAKAPHTPSCSPWSPRWRFSCRLASTRTTCTWTWTSRRCPTVWWVPLAAGRWQTARRRVGGRVSH